MLRPLSLSRSGAGTADTVSCPLILPRCDAPGTLGRGPLDVFLAGPGFFGNGGSGLFGGGYAIFAAGG